MLLEDKFRIELANLAHYAFNIFSFFLFSYWADPDEISDIDHIRAMEQSLKESLSRIQTHKVTTHFGTIDA